jgi:predicted MPP superfamily phosphohydrolase
MLLVLSLAVWICYRVWAKMSERRAARWVAGIVLAMGLSDGFALAALPYLGLSYGPVGFSWLAMLTIRAGLALVAAFTWRNIPGKRQVGNMGLLLAINLAILACEIYGLYIEPFNLSVTPVRLAWPTTVDSPPLRIVQLSDLHVERMTKRERAVLDAVERLKPDLILLTGDYLNWSYVDDEAARRDARAVLRQLHAPYGVYAIPGTPVVDTPGALQALFTDMDNITLLYDDIAQVDVNGQTIYLVGVANLEWQRDRESLRALMNRLPPNALTILMYHTPDLIETASELGVDIYLAGHTHGGQIRLPWYGAIVTSSRYLKRYEAGLYQVGPTQLYVSRGIGMEGLAAPRVRFLCAPEIVELTLTRR